MARTLTPAQQADILARHAEMERRGYFTPGADHGLTPLQLREAFAWRDRMRERGHLPTPPEDLAQREPTVPMPKRRRSRPGFENLGRLSQADRERALEQFLAAGARHDRLRPRPR
jgi:hypothetical protein